MFVLSVAVAIYNSERYLGECLESLVHQTLNNIEIILVSDASPDNSMDIMKKYESKYKPNVKIVELQQNGRLGGARQAGLQAASGKYFAYVDGDDFVDIQMYEKLVMAALEKECELVTCWECRFDDETKQKINHNYGGGFCRIVNVDFLKKNNIEFISNNMYSDNYFWALVDLYVKKREEVSQCLYYAREQNASIRHTTNSRNIKDRMEAEEKLLAEIWNRNLVDNLSDSFILEIISRYCINTYYLFALINKVDMELFDYYVKKTNDFLTNKICFFPRNKIYNNYYFCNKILLWSLIHSKKISIVLVLFSATILKRARLIKRWIQSKL